MFLYWRLPLKSALTLIITVWSICHGGISSAQTYKWVDDEGRIHYSNDPYAAKKAEGGAQKVGRLSAPPPAANNAVDNDADVKDATGQLEKESTAKGEVVLTGDFEINHSVSGRAVIETTLQNQSSQPVEGVSLRVILFLADKGPVDEIVIPVKGGKKKPGGLQPGEIGKVEYETDYDPGEVVGYKYKVVWDVMTPKSREKTSNGDAPGESDAVEKEVKDKTDEKPMNRFRRNVENKRKKRLEESEQAKENK